MKDTAAGMLRHMSLRDLPGVDTLVQTLSAEKFSTGLPEALIVDIARRAIDETRRDLQVGSSPRPADQSARATITVLSVASTRPIINATGVLLHTNLGRAPLHAEAAEAAATAMRESTNLEFDLSTHDRGGRAGYVKALLTALTGAEAALVLNNNAAALLLTLAALSNGQRTVVSRGELIEIGGSFRLPELMAASGALIDEVGTTNRTRKSDYERATLGAGIVLKVHPSNYILQGFTEETSWRDVADVATEHGVPFVADIGSGLLDATVPWIPGPPPAWLSDEPGVKQTLADGADLVLFSGDKLIGGPQAGIIVGTSDLVDRLRVHPIARGVRIDGASLAALETTLALYAEGKTLEIPFWRRATMGLNALSERHRRLIDTVRFTGDLVTADSVPGAGTVPGVGIPSIVATFECNADDVWHKLLDRHTPILARRRDGCLVIDLRSVDETRDGEIANALNTV